ncbi:unnamed protein product [Tilletia controversa]|nr:unnamed protein product [Tilletia controversa]
MLVDAQKIWNSLLRSSLMLSIACIAWFIIGTALASLYTGVVWRTVRSLQDFLATQEAIHGRTNASSTSTGSASRPQFWPFSKKHTESSTAQKNPVPVPVWRPEDSSETMINMGHQHARHVLTCFIVQCSMFWIRALLKCDELVLTILQVASSWEGSACWFLLSA